MYLSISIYSYLSINLCKFVHFTSSFANGPGDLSSIPIASNQRL